MRCKFYARNLGEKLNINRTKVFSRIYFPRQIFVLPHSFDFMYFTVLFCCLSCSRLRWLLVTAFKLKLNTCV